MCYSVDWIKLEKYETISNSWAYRPWCSDYGEYWCILFAYIPSIPSFFVSSQFDVDWRKPCELMISLCIINGNSTSFKCFNEAINGVAKCQTISKKLCIALIFTILKTFLTVTAKRNRERERFDCMVTYSIDV